jgi:hypothetical protein
MTIREMMKKELIDSGMLCDDAEKVLQIAASSDAMKSMADRWNDSTEGYPPHLLPSVCMNLKEIALKWIDDNCPLAWYRPLFV